MQDLKVSGLFNRVFRERYKNDTKENTGICTEKSLFCKMKSYRKERIKNMLSESIAKLVQYGVETELIPECERNYTTNLLLDVFYEDDYTAPEQEFQNIELEKVLDELLKEAIDRGLIEDSVVYKDLFDTRLMNCLMPRPAEVQTTFWKKYGENPKAACRRFYFKP